MHKVLPLAVTALVSALFAIPAEASSLTSVPSPKAKLGIAGPGLTSKVTSEAFLYVPNPFGTPGPLIVLLHGAGGDAYKFLDEFKDSADSYGASLLAVQSEGRTWPQRAPQPSDKDVANIDAALREVFSRLPIQPSRVAIMGFSDGASYALTLGLDNPQLFRTIVAFSPGYAFAPRQLDTDQKIFIAHGRRDPVLPAENTRRMIEELKRAGFAPQVRWFNGRHEIDPRVKQLGFEATLVP